MKLASTNLTSEPILVSFLGSYLLVTLHRVIHYYFWFELNRNRSKSTTLTIEEKGYVLLWCEPSFFLALDYHKRGMVRASLQTILYCREREKMENIFKNPRKNFTWSNRGQVTLYQYHNSLFFNWYWLAVNQFDFVMPLRKHYLGYNTHFRTVHY